MFRRRKRSGTSREKKVTIPPARPYTKEQAEELLSQIRAVRKQMNKRLWAQQKELDEAQQAAREAIRSAALERGMTMTNGLKELLDECFPGWVSARVDVLDADGNTFIHTVDTNRNSRDS